MIVTGVVCRHCKQPVWSRSRYDFRYCFCGDTFVDGGQDYLRYGSNTLPEVVKIDTDLDEVVDEHQETIR